MALHFHHRKLINDSVTGQPVALPCERACEPDSICRAPCLTFCLEFCKSKVLSVTPPPPLLTPPPPPPSDAAVADLEKSRQLSLLLIASLAVLAIAFFLFTCYTIYKFYTVWRSSSRRRRQLSQRRHPEEEEDGGGFLDEDHLPVVDHPIWYIRTIGLQPSVINAITIVKYKRADGLVEGTDCAVCLNDFQEDETLRLLPKCNHAFHIPCIDKWLGSHTNCPMCRAGIVSNVADPLSSQEVVARDSDLTVEAWSESVSFRIEDPPAAGSDSGLEMNEDVEGDDCKLDLDRSDVLQPIRRSVSMDSSSASIISAAVANAFPQQPDAQMAIGKETRVENGAKRVGVNQSLLRLAGSPAIGRSTQTGSSSIKRSSSCRAKVFLSRHSSRV